MSWYKTDQSLTEIIFYYTKYNLFHSRSYFNFNKYKSEQWHKILVKWISCEYLLSYCMMMAVQSTSSLRHRSSSYLRLQIVIEVQGPSRLTLLFVWIFNMDCMSFWNGITRCAKSDVAVSETWTISTRRRRWRKSSDILWATSTTPSSFAVWFVFFIRTTWWWRRRISIH